MRDVRVPLTACLLLGLVTACAKVAPPPGGTEDREPPSIHTDAVRPAPGAAGVAPQDTVTIVFSERLDRRSVMRALQVIPSVDFEDVAWDVDTLRLVPDPAWADGRNTWIRIGVGARDRRGNPLDAPFQYHFTTKARPDSGEAAGRVWGGKEHDPARRIVVLALDAADTLDLNVAQPHSITLAAADGQYRLIGLDTAKAWRIAALLDQDDDLRAGRNDVSAVSPDPIFFEPSEREATVPEFLVGTLDTLGLITGEASADSAAHVYVVATSGDGAEVGRDGPLVGGGAFEVTAPTGFRYGVGAFVDANGDSVRNEDEEWVEREGGVSLVFVSKAGGLSFDLSSPEVEEDLEIPGTREALGGAADADSAAAGGGP